MGPGGAYLKKSSGISLLERLDAELEQAGGVLELAGASGHLVLQSSQLHLLALPDEVQQFLLAPVDRLYQGVTLCRHLALKIRRVLLQEIKTS
jgi:hypothetical protein